MLRLQIGIPLDVLIDEFLVMTMVNPFVCYFHMPAGLVTRSDVAELKLLAEGAAILVLVLRVFALLIISMRIFMICLQMTMIDVVALGFGRIETCSVYFFFLRLAVHYLLRACCKMFLTLFYLALFGVVRLFILMRWLYLCGLLL